MFSRLSKQWPQLKTIQQRAQIKQPQRRLTHSSPQSTNTPSYSRTQPKQIPGAVTTKTFWSYLNWTDLKNKIFGTKPISTYAMTVEPSPNNKRLQTQNTKPDTFARLDAIKTLSEMTNL